jgi:hypothetical protein
VEKNVLFHSNLHKVNLFIVAIVSLLTVPNPKSPQAEDQPGLNPNKHGRVAETMDKCRRWMNAINLYKSSPMQSNKKLIRKMN